MKFLNHSSFKWIGLAVIFTASLFSCRKSESLPEDMVAQVNDHYLRLKQVNASVPNGLSEDLSLSLKKNVISRWVENEALYQAAIVKGVKLTDYDKFLVNEYRKSLIIQKYIDQTFNKERPVSEKEIDDYYNKHEGEFQRDKNEVHVIHLFMDQYDPNIFKEIKNANDLTPIIKKYYLNEKSGVNQPNGDLGYLAVSQFPSKLAKVLMRMKTGTICRPIKTKDGYHFFQLLDRQKKGTIRSLNLVRDDIILRIKKQHRDQEIKKLIQEAKQKVQIQTYLSKIQ